jgi:hypothetical protein
VTTAIAGRSTPPRRATVRILSSCDNACVFCGQQGTPEHVPPRDEITRLLEAARAVSSEVTLTGGEPTLHPDLAGIVEEARRRGFARIGIQSNGRRPEMMRALAAAGLSDVHLSIHGGVAAAHDYHTRIDGSFAQALATLSEARAVGLDVAVTTVLTRSNARGLGDLARVLSMRSASAWCITVPRVRGRASDLFDRVVPRLGIAMPFAIHALQIAMAARIPVFFRGAPSCLLGPFAKHALVEAELAGERAYGEACSGCEARPACPGVEPTYLARFAGDELSAVKLVPRLAESELARLFVGEGVLAEPTARAIDAAPAQARFALPMLGKVQPARAEVPRTVEKKSGAALREIFKELFVEEETKGAD